MNREKRPSILSTSAAGMLKKQSFISRNAGRYGIIAACAALLAAGASSAQAATQTWVGGGGNDNWSTAGNFLPGAPGVFDDLVFTGNLRTSNINDAPSAFNSITFAAGAASFTLGGQDLAIDAGGITNLSSSLQTISFVSPIAGNAGINLTDFNGGAQTWNAAAGDILITSDVAFGAPVTVTVTGAYNTTITGVISDAGTPPYFGSIVKDGSGVLRLTAQNTFPGNTTINGGTLLVDGSTASANTFVNSGGTLGGRGRINGLVINAGNVSPGDVAPNNTIGTLTVKKYTQTSGGTLNIEISGKNSGQYDVLAVQGEASLDGSLRLVKVGQGPRLKAGEKITFLTAEGGVDGKFSSVSNPFTSDTIIKPTVVYSGNSVALEGKQGSFKDYANQAGLTHNQRAVAAGLDKIAFRNSPPQVIRYLDTRPLVELPGDFDKIAPEELAAIFNIGVSLATVQTQNLQRRTSDLRSGSNGFSAAGFHTAGSGPNYSGNFGVAGPTGNEGKDSKKTFVPAEENRWGAFLTGVGEWVDVDGDGNARGYDITTGGFTLGLDYKITPNLAVGINAGYAGTGADLNNGGRVFVNGGKLGVYGTYFTGGFYVDAAVNGGYNSYDTRRSALRGTARGSTDGGELNVLVGTGYDWQIGALTIGPTVNFQYTYVGIDSYTENGSIAPLNIRSQGGESIRTAIGFKTSYDWRAGGVIIKPELRAAWQHEYGDSSFDVDSGFSAAGNTGFTVRGPEVGRDSLLLGAGVAVLWNERTSTYVYYDGELFRDSYQSHNVSGGVRLSF